MYRFEDAQTGGLFILNPNFDRWTQKNLPEKDLIHILWNRSKSPRRLIIDDQVQVLEADHITAITYLNQISIDGPESGILGLSFNRNFYCIVDLG